GMCLLTLTVSLPMLRPPPCAQVGTGGTKPNISTIGADQFDEFEPKERHRLPSGSPLTRMVQVFVAAMRKWNLNVPIDSKELHEVSIEEYTSKGRYRINHSSSL
ncbi:peptide transporter PTR3-a-like protein, partial [Trifolium pratense]